MVPADSANSDPGGLLCQGPSYGWGPSANDFPHLLPCYDLFEEAF